MFSASSFAPRKNSIDLRHPQRRMRAVSRKLLAKDCIRMIAHIAIFGISPSKSKTKMKMVLKIKKNLVRFHIHENRAKGNIMSKIIPKGDASTIAKAKAYDPAPDPLLQLRAEALLVCGYDPHHKGEISLEQFDEGREDRLHSHLIEATLGRCLLRYLNARARAN